MADIKKIQLGTTTYDIVDDNALHSTDVGDTVNPVGTTSAAGTSTAYSRADHVHNITSSTITAALGYTPASGGVFVGDSTSTPGENDFIWIEV